jgi:hypothetical protein
VGWPGVIALGWRGDSGWQLRRWLGVVAVGRDADGGLMVMNRDATQKLWGGQESVTLVQVIVVLVLKPHLVRAVLQSMWRRDW